MTAYPNLIDGFAQLPLLIDLVSPVKADDVNRVRNAAIAIENELGIQPSSTYGTVRARLDAMELGIDNIGSLNTKGDILTRNSTEDIALPVGSDGYILTAQSSTDTGLSWSPTSGSTVIRNSVVALNTISVGQFSPTATSTMHVHGSTATRVISVAGSYTASANETIILVDAALGIATITLPSAAICTDRVYYIKKIDASANVVIIATAGGQTLDGIGTYVVDQQYESLTVVSNGANWFAI